MDLKTILSKVARVLAISIVALISLCDSSQVAYAQRRAYVANFGSDTVSVIDTSSNALVATVAVGTQPLGVAVTPDGTHVYVANCGGDVWVIDTSTNKVSAKVVVGGCPTGVVVTPDGKHAYVTKDNANSVAVLDISSNTVVTTIMVGTAPGGVAITPDGNHVYVANVGTGTGTVSVIDTATNTVTATVNVGNISPVGVAITPDGTRVYVKGGTGSLPVIATSSNTVVATVTLTGNDINPFGLAISPDGARVYVTRFNANALAVIDTSSNAVTATPAVGGYPNGVALTPDGTRAYVTTSKDATGLGNGTVSVIDTSSNAIIATVGVGSTPYGMAFAPGSGNPVLPVITSGGIVPATVQSGEWASIYGTNLASSAATWTGNFPTTLGGTSVTVDGKPAYLSYVSPGQINLQVPNDSAIGQVSVVVTTSGGSGTSTVTLAAFGPSFFLLDAKHVAGIILRSDGSGAYGGGSYDIIGPTGTSIGYQTVAAKAGDAIELFGTGFGPTNPSVLAGQTFAGAAPATNPVTLQLNNVSVTPTFAGLSGPGVYQFNLTLPAGVGTGDVPLQAIVGGAQTPAGVVISVQQ